MEVPEGRSTSRTSDQPFLCPTTGSAEGAPPQVGAIVCVGVVDSGLAYAGVGWPTRATKVQGGTSVVGCRLSEAVGGEVVGVRPRHQVPDPGAQPHEDQDDGQRHPDPSPPIRPSARRTVPGRLHAISSQGVTPGAPCHGCRDTERLGRRRFFKLVASGAALALAGVGLGTRQASGTRVRRAASVPVAGPAPIVADAGGGPPLTLGDIPAPRPGAPQLLWHAPATTQQIALTVDDGYCGRLHREVRRVRGRAPASI